MLYLPTVWAKRFPRDLKRDVLLGGRWRRPCSVLGWAMMIYGLVAFFGIITVNYEGGSHGLNWPIGFANDVIPLADGRRLVAHEPSGRIQIYDKDWRFLTGWSVGAAGGEFKTQLDERSRVNVRAMRSRTHSVYTLKGEKIETGKYDPDDPALPTWTHGAGWVPTPFLLWGFTHPLFGVLVGFWGLGIWHFARNGLRSNGSEDESKVSKD
jgi:hypothetical protein